MCQVSGREAKFTSVQQELYVWAHVLSLFLFMVNYGLGEKLEQLCTLGQTGNLSPGRLRYRVLSCLAYCNIESLDGNG